MQSDHILVNYSIAPGFLRYEKIKTLFRICTLESVTLPGRFYSSRTISRIGGLGQNFSFLLQKSQGVWAMMSIHMIYVIPRGNAL